MKNGKETIGERVVRIETKLDDVTTHLNLIGNNVSQIRQDMLNIPVRELVKDVADLKDSRKWIIRSVIGTLLTGLVGVAVACFK